jgi:hypothetical protein
MAAAFHLIEEHVTHAVTVHSTPPHSSSSARVCATVDQVPCDPIPNASAAAFGLCGNTVMARAVAVGLTAEVAALPHGTRRRAMDGNVPLAGNGLQEHAASVWTFIEG